ncbi:hypothetical protein PPL_04013 [Heterostelium album PN500]|uniref:Uncharacterized protein n=1 Tax=Heterostelium pallidum (strain ATCC 26659 / Pp 5 / PN500) TaxID=670386 RepID=D3B5S5_HETP5|nr:hypothetical protein PPL_04013 [Heterostelium album PN500]EFA83223.1 hypothetical protein PPL_04013 [Heterostelium album PN500]|eukprot:XP_020435340.1 hypothetical protein PPL_04013 [Heterostelium album PN500]
MSRNDQATSLCLTWVSCSVYNKVFNRVLTDKRSLSENTATSWIFKVQLIAKFEKFKQLNLFESKDGKECYGVYIDHIKEVQEMVAKYLKDNPKRYYGIHRKIIVRERYNKIF